MSEVSGSEELTLRSGFTLVIDVSHGSLAGHKLCHCLQFPFITASTDHPGWQHNSFGDQYGHREEKALKCCHLCRGTTLIFSLMQNPEETCLSLKAGTECSWPVIGLWTLRHVSCQKRLISHWKKKHGMTENLPCAGKCFILFVHIRKTQVLPGTQSSFWSGGGFPAVHHFQLWQQQQQQANRTHWNVVSHLHVHKRAKIH